MDEGATSGTPSQMCGDPNDRRAKHKGRSAEIVKLADVRPEHLKESKCISIYGQFWVAVGVGWCEPKSWTSWERRWWGDSWCYCIGAVAEVSYMEDYVAPSSTNWEYDVGLDFE